MTIKYCYRCLVKFNQDRRLVAHLSKKNKCQINNTHYDIEYDNKLMDLINEHNWDKDVDNYIIEIEGNHNIVLYGCVLCNMRFSKKHHTHRHIMESCNKYKYIIDDKLLNMINQLTNVDGNISNNVIINQLIHVDGKISNNDTINQLIHADGKISNNAIVINNDILMKMLETVKREVQETLTKEVRETLTNEVREAVTKELNESVDKKLKVGFDEIKKNPINHNTLHIVCMNNRDCLNLLDERFGDFPKVLKFIENCALSKLTGDVKLLKELYIDNKFSNMWYLDSRHEKIAWVDNKALLQRNIITLNLCVKLL